MTVNIPSSGIEIKLDRVELKLERVIDEMRFLKSHTIAMDSRLRGIEAYLKPSEPSEQQPDSKFTPWFAADAMRDGKHGVCLQSGQRSARP